MVRISCFLKVLLVFSMFVISKNTMAFHCYSYGKTYEMAAANIPKKTTDAALATDAFSTGCEGNTTYGTYDAMRIERVTVNAAVQSAGYVVEFSLGGSGWLSSWSVIYACIWPTGNTSYNCTSVTGTMANIRSIRMRLRRNSNADIITPIPDNTIIANISAIQRSGGIWGGKDTKSINVSAKLVGQLTTVVPTCDVKNFDSNVPLPDIKRTDLENHGAGRYTGVTKEFNINLACEYKPKVSVKFDGEKMPGVTSEDVLVNKLSGNDNVGVQIVYNSNPLKIGSNVAVINSAEASETLKFNAYYYYKGGTVQSGSIKSQTEFTFSYE